jgi:hypothetical protein
MGTKDLSEIRMGVYSDSGRDWGVCWSKTSSMSCWEDACKKRLVVVVLVVVLVVVVAHGEKAVVADDVKQMRKKDCKSMSWKRCIVLCLRACFRCSMCALIV